MAAELSENAEFGETYTRAGLSLILGLAARAPKRDGYHGCPYPILATDRAWTGPEHGSEILAMNQFVTFGFVLLLVGLLVALDGALALRAIDRLAQSEDFNDIRSAMTHTDVYSVR
jgi:hypothetical protein